MPFPPAFPWNRVKWKSIIGMLVNITGQNLFWVFFPAWTFVTSAFNLEGVTFMSELQIFQIKDVVCTQNKCLLGHDFSVMETYRIRKKTGEKASCACKGNEFVILWTVHLLASWWDGESWRGLMSLPFSSHSLCHTLWLLAYSSVIWSTKSEHGTEKSKKNGRVTVCRNCITELNFRW